MLGKINLEKFSYIFRNLKKKTAVFSTLLTLSFQRLANMHRLLVDDRVYDLYMTW